MVVVVVVVLRLHIRRVLAMARPDFLVLLVLNKKKGALEDNYGEYVGIMV